MGYFWQGLPPYVIDWSRGMLPSDSISVETGTFQGETTLLLADAFGSCVTIERSEGLAQAAQQRFARDSRIRVLQGSSRDRLAESLPPKDQGCFFWLDAHGMYDYAGPDREENPLLAELEIVFQFRGTSSNVIAVDDARGMGTQPGWPPLSRILALMADYGYEGVIVDDCLVAASRSDEPNFALLYRASRQVEIPAVFHLWPQINKLSRARATSDRVITRVQGLLKR